MRWCLFGLLPCTGTHMTAPHTRLLCAAALGLWLAPWAQAGQASAANPTLSVVISDSAGHSWDLGDELTSMLSFNAATGDLSLTPTAVAGDGDGVWTKNASVTLANGQVVTGLAWHSTLTSNGTLAQSTDASNPWAASLIVTHVAGNVDPSMDYGFYFKNSSSATQTYTVQYSESIMPTIYGAYEVSASLSGASTNIDGSTTIAPTGDLIQHLWLSNGQAAVSAGVDVGPGATAAGTATYGPYTATTTGVAPELGYTSWGFRTQFTLTGNKDVFVANGSAVITSVPEPQSLALAILSLVIIGTAALHRSDD